MGSRLGLLAAAQPRDGERQEGVRPRVADGRELDEVVGIAEDWLEPAEAVAEGVDGAEKSLHARGIGMSDQETLFRAHTGSVCGGSAGSR